MARPTISISTVSPIIEYTGWGGDAYGCYISRWKLWSGQMISGIKESVTLAITIEDPLSKGYDVAVSIETPDVWYTAGSGTLSESLIHFDGSGTKNIIYTKSNESDGYNVTGSNCYNPISRYVLIKAKIVGNETISSKAFLSYRDHMSFSYMCFSDGSIVRNGSWDETTEHVDYGCESGEQSMTIITYGDGSSLCFDGGLGYCEIR